MKDYAVIPNTVGSFPLVVSQNASGAGATDGTPYIADFIDDIWGARQALMSKAGLTPSGVVEVDGNSQALAAQYRVLGGPGDVVMYDKNDDPAVHGDRKLLLSGQGILVASYPDLVAAVFNQANYPGGAYYRADNAAGTIPNASGAYMILPDSRGRAPRGRDVGALVDPDGASRKLGGVQSDGFQGHNMNVFGEDSSEPLYLIGSSGSSTNSVFSNGSFTSGVQAFAKDFFTDGINGTPRVGSETVMSNWQTQFAIIY